MSDMYSWQFNDERKTVLVLNCIRVLAVRNSVGLLGLDIRYAVYSSMAEASMETLTLAYPRDGEELRDRDKEQFLQWLASVSKS